MKLAFVVVGLVFTAIAGYGMYWIYSLNPAYIPPNTTQYYIALLCMGLILIGGLALLAEGIKPGSVWTSRKSGQSPS